MTTTIPAVDDGSGQIVDLVVAEGRVVARHPVAGVPHGSERRMVLPGLVEPHAHLDKALSAPATARLLGGPVPRSAGLLAAVAAWDAYLEHVTVEDAAERASKALSLYLAHGVTALRTHVHVGGPAGMRSLEGVLAAREAVADVMTVQVVAMPAPPMVGAMGGASRDVLVAALDLGADVVGGWPWGDPEPAEAIRYLVMTAAERGLPLDLHLDETLDPRCLTLETLARTVLEVDPGIAVSAGHCCSLAVQEPDRRFAVCDLVARAGITVITLPQTNLWLQGDGSGASPRGITAVNELRTAGARVIAGGDNVRDVFNPLGRADPLEAAGLVQVLAQVDTAVALNMVTRAARAGLGLPAAGAAVGEIADLVVLPGIDLPDVLAAAPVSRDVFTAGRMVSSTQVSRT